MLDRIKEMENGTGKEQNNEDQKVSFYFDSDREVSPQAIGASACIEHPVSKFDTLAGIAIKYGVEVADIRKMNGLVTDRQIFALKTINIPLPGRHPPSPCLSYDATSPGQGNSNPPCTDAGHLELFESFHSLKGKPSEPKVSQAMSSLQGFYGLKQATNSSEDNSHSPNRPLHQHRKSRSLVDIILAEVMEKGHVEEAAQVRQEGELEKWNDKLIRRRQKSEADFSRIPELLLKEDSSSASVGPPSRTGKRLALRQKVGSRSALTSDSESSGIMKTGDASEWSSSLSSGVRKSYSTPCFQDQDNSCTSSIWPPSVWTLKPDLQVLPKPRRNKAALD
ncbi:hypothetical protein HN51_033542 [Arachis hypogaea]|nr:uncharacterized protein LOC112717158 [Arachis hypogaea]QHO18063.1 LysM and putative peptidoglycan-binding domain-containing protein [Arachis hypogaea]